MPPEQEAEKSLKGKIVIADVNALSPDEKARLEFLGAIVITKRQGYGVTVVDG